MRLQVHRKVNKAVSIAQVIMEALQSLIGKRKAREKGTSFIVQTPRPRHRVVIENDTERAGSVTLPMGDDDPTPPGRPRYTFSGILNQ